MANFACLQPFLVCITIGVLVFGFVRTGKFGWIAAWREHELSLVCLSRKSRSMVSVRGPSPEK
jgi:hypothetical protein